MAEQDTENNGLSPREVRAMRAVEDDLWWYRALRAHVLNCLRPTRADFKLLDAGCGSGGMLARIHERFPKANLTGIDLSESALELTRKRQTNAQLMRASTNDLPFADGTFDFVLSLDVLAFRGVDDRRAVMEMQRVLRPGGALIMNVPAFDFLRGSHDAAVNQIRRYNRGQFAALFTAAGFERARFTYWNMSLLPAVAAVRWASREKAEEPEVHSDLAPIWPPANAILGAIAQTELLVSRYFPLPFGTSLFAVAHK